MTRTVLVVDDDAGIRELLRFRLEKSGFEVDTSANGQECIDSLHGSLPDLVLLDIRMPRMDGLETLETIRTEFATDLPVVLLSGAQSGTDVENAATTERIDKPFTMDEVVTCVERVLGHE
jgi:CheY-like chemotaxis protein